MLLTYLSPCPVCAILRTKLDHYGNSNELPALLKCLRTNATIVICMKQKTQLSVRFPSVHTTPHGKI